MTSSHLMVMFKAKGLQMMAAKDVRVHDVMGFEDFSLSKIVKIKDVTIPTKVNIATSNGILYANGILTSGLCENAESNRIYGHELLEDDTISHFGNNTVVA